MPLLVVTPCIEEIIILYYLLPYYTGRIISSNATFFSYEIDLNRFFEGSHTVVTTVTDAGGNSDQETTPFTVPPPLGK